jgi:hypothetical protein
MECSEQNALAKLCASKIQMIPGTMQCVDHTTMEENYVREQDQQKDELRKNLILGNEDIDAIVIN